MLTQTLSRRLFCVPTGMRTILLYEASGKTFRSQNYADVRAHYRAASMVVAETEAGGIVEPSVSQWPQKFLAAAHTLEYLLATLHALP